MTIAFLATLMLASICIVFPVRAEVRADADIRFYTSADLGYAALKANNVDFIQWSLTHEQRQDSDHPNQEDLNIAEEYAEKTLIRFKGEEPGLVEFGAPELTEKKVDKTEDSVNKRRIPPSRHGEECSMCKTCEKNCPSSAMDAELGEADPEKCIGCLRCVYNCPDNALKIVDRTKMYTVLEKALNLTPEILASRKS